MLTPLEKHHGRCLEVRAEVRRKDNRSVSPETQSSTQHARHTHGPKHWIWVWSRGIIAMTKRFERQKPCSSLILTRTSIRRTRSATRRLKNRCDRLGAKPRWKTCNKKVVQMASKRFVQSRPARFTVLTIATSVTALVRILSGLRVFAHLTPTTRIARACCNSSSVTIAFAECEAFPQKTDNSTTREYGPFGRQAWSKGS